MYRAERCANTEGLNRYLNECDKNEKIYEQNCEDMNNELDEALDMIAEIIKRYDLRDEAIEYVKDML